MVHSGKLWAAVRIVTDHNSGRLYAPDDICTKTGRQVLDVLRKKHPDARIPEKNDFDSYANSAELHGKPVATACWWRRWKNVPWRMAFPTLTPTAVSSWNLWGGDSTRWCTQASFGRRLTAIAITAFS